MFRKKGFPAHCIKEKTMIKNVVFDIGNVLVNFRWRELMAQLQLSKEAQDRFEDYVFGSKWWHEFDHSTMDEEEVLCHLREDNEEYRDAFELVWENRDKLVEPYEYAVTWIADLQAAGYRVYLLSNYPATLFSMHAENGSFPFLDMVDGKVVSGYVKMIKPEPDIYEYLVENYGLKASECVFLDDRAENVEGAKQVGMHGIQVHNYEQAKRELDELMKKQQPCL